MVAALIRFSLNYGRFEKSLTKYLNISAKFLKKTNGGEWNWKVEYKYVFK